MTVAPEFVGLKASLPQYKQTITTDCMWRNTLAKFPALKTSTEVVVESRFPRSMSHHLIQFIPFQLPLTLCQFRVTHRPNIPYPTLMATCKTSMGGRNKQGPRNTILMEAASQPRSRVPFNNAGDIEVLFSFNNYHNFRRSIQRLIECGQEHFLVIQRRHRLYSHALSFTIRSISMIRHQLG